jgi:hypothetical protein
MITFNYKKIVHKKFNSPKVKITVEEIGPEKFIATEWIKGDCYEVDRTVYEFETFGGAMDRAFDLMADHAEWLADENVTRK